MGKKKKKLQKLKHKFRLVILNDDTFEEKISIRLSQLNVFALVGITTLFLVVSVTILIAFTPLREFIPGYANVNVRKEGIRNTLRADSIALVLQQKQVYIENLKHLILGEPIVFEEEQKVDSNINYQDIVNQPVLEDSILRDMVETEERYNLFGKSETTPNTISNFLFFPPLKGIITEHFNLKETHFGIDIVAPKNEVIKATLDGTVIFAEYTTETGYVIQLQHENNLISIYKHNSVLHKKVGEHVKAGEVISIVGNTGDLTTGPHLHFELWYNGIALNPEDYMTF